MHDDLNRPLDVATAGTRHCEHKRSLGLKKSTLSDYEGYLRVHLAPFFGSTPLDEIDLEMLEAFVRAEQEEGLAPKSILNHLVLLNGIFNHALKRGWCKHNPVPSLDKPRTPRNADIRFLTLSEVEAILAAAPPTELGRIDRLVYLTAVMTGMRRGEVVAIRWQDIDWDTRVIRVRRNYTRGEFGTPKSRRSSRAVPLADRLVAELRTHYELTHKPRRARPRLHQSSERNGSRPIEAAATVRGLCAASRRSPRPLPRPPPHLRDADGRGGRPFACCSGVARSHRLPHNSDLRRLRPRSSPRGAIRRVGVWSDTRFPECCRAPVSETGKTNLRCNLHRGSVTTPLSNCEPATEVPGLHSVGEVGESQCWSIGVVGNWFLRPLRGVARLWVEAGCVQKNGLGATRFQAFRVLVVLRAKMSFGEKPGVHCQTRIFGRTIEAFTSAELLNVFREIFVRGDYTFSN